jgi:2-polyprenyl-3-methyl-5-hydroxy-6-metoxy-1,4-benzoquinol methylase
MSEDRFNAEAATWDFHQDRVERARIIAEQIFQLVPITKEMQVMDFGSGTGLLGFHFVEKAKTVTFADTSKGMLEQVESKAQKGNMKNVGTINLTEQSLPGHYDVIVSLLTLHHIEDTQDCIRTLANQLLPGGTLCICDLDKEDGSFHGEKKVPHNGFVRSDIESTFKNSQLGEFKVCTGMIEKKVIDGAFVEYPIFIAIGRKAGSTSN